MENKLKHNRWILRPPYNYTSRYTTSIDEHGNCIEGESIISTSDKQALLREGVRRANLHVVKETFCLNTLDKFNDPCNCSANASNDFQAIEVRIDSKPHYYDQKHSWLFKVIVKSLNKIVYFFLKRFGKI